MDIVINLLFIQLALLVIANLVIFLNKSNNISTKLNQSIFSFLLPIVGPIITLTVLLGDKNKKKEVPEKYMGQSIDESPYIEP